jgi:hypothetical protein
MSALLDAARSLSPAMRKEFLRDIAVALADRSDIGDGQLGRVLRELQRRHLTPRASAG